MIHNNLDFIKAATAQKVGIPASVLNRLLSNYNRPINEWSEEVEIMESPFKEETLIFRKLIFYGRSGNKIAAFRGKEK